MAPTITEHKVLALEMVKKEGIAEPIDVVLATILEQLGSGMRDAQMYLVVRGRLEEVFPHEKPL